MNSATRHRASVVVIDDFCKEPLALREFALSQPSAEHLPGPGAMYSYRRAKPDPMQATRCVDQILEYIGRRHRNDFITSFFVFEDSKDEAISRKNTWVHFDRWRWVGVLYLNTPEQCQGGTTFFRHRATGFTRWEQVVADMRVGGQSDSVIARDTNRSTEWETVLDIGMQFNRLVLFDGRQFHQASCYFGSSKQDCRLFQQFTFRHVDDSEDYPW